ncbi:LuxR C-terminal-related transcriptional regulator [Chloroflexi bacterium TSY]|nr:LuxR C-terminal-related transcriptional regulator [Chloroflexi bacterium TSY]
MAGAAEHYHEAIRLSELGQLMSVAFRAYLQSLLLYTEVGESDQAATLMQKLTSLAERFTDRWSDLLAQNLQEINALLALRRGDLSAVARWTKSAGLSVNGSPEDRHGAHIIFAQYLIAYSYAKDDSTVLSGAVQLLQKLIEMAEQGGYVDSCINLRADLALAYYGLHNGEQAVAELEEALRLAQPEGYVRTFLDRGMPMLELLQFAEKQSLYPDYTSELLRAFEGETGKAVGHQDGLEIDRASGKQTLAALIEPLTEREEEVLQLIVDGLTNREIAEKLIISVATVKRHVYNIYGKLGVKHRGQAIAWVRERHL